MEILIPILFSSAVVMAIGFMWYSPVMFGDTWASILGLKKTDMECKEGMGRVMILSVLMAVITSTVIYTLVSTKAFYLPSIYAIWLAFALPVYAGPCLWEKKPWKLFFINAGYGIVSITFATELLVMWSY